MTRFTTSDMTPFYRAIALAAAVVATLGASQVAAQQNTNPTAAAIDTFNKQVKAYMDVHVKAEQGAPNVKQGASPAEVLAFEKALAERIRAARPTAKQGDVFAPEVVPV